MTCSELMATKDYQEDLRVRIRVPLFFVLLVASLGLSDAPQNISDLYWPAMTVITVPLWETMVSVLSGWQITALLSLTAIVYAVSGVFSWSPAFSVTAILRLLTGFLWLRRFLMVRPDEREHIPAFLEIIALILVSSAFLNIFVPASRSLFPEFTLLGSPSGHLASVYLALPILILLDRLPPKRTGLILRTAGTVAAALTVLFSFSRAALFLAAFYFGITAAIKKSPRPAKIMQAALFLLFAAAGLLLSRAAGTAYTGTRFPVPETARVYITKDTLSQNPRTEFIREGIRGFLTSPLLGTGPGTFALVSEQFASKQNSVSAYAHTAMANILTETGVAGLLCLVTLTGYILYMLYREKKRLPPDAGPYLFALTAVLILSTIHPVFSHYPLFIAVMMVFGLIIAPAFPVRKTKDSPFIAGAVLLLLLFTVSWIGSNVLSGNNQSNGAYLFAPYRKELAIRAIRTLHPLPASTRSEIARMFPRDSSIFTAFAENAPGESERTAWTKQAIAAYPTDTALQASYLSHVALTDSPKICETLQYLSTDRDIPCDDANFQDLARTDGFRRHIQLWNSPFGKAKFLYAVGLDMYRSDADPRPIAHLWASARDAAPQWGYFHIELASIVALINRNKETAIPILLSCASYPPTARQCEGYRNDLSKLPDPGYWEPEIMAIPEIISDR